MPLGAEMDPTTTYFVPCFPGIAAEQSFSSACLVSADARICHRRREKPQPRKTAPSIRLQGAQEKEDSQQLFLLPLQHCCSWESSFSLIPCLPFLLDDHVQTGNGAVQA